MLLTHPGMSIAEYWTKPVPPVIERYATLPLVDDRGLAEDEVVGTALRFGAKRVHRGLVLVLQSDDLFDGNGLREDCR
jgi:hypothetical protein